MATGAVAIGSAAAGGAVLLTGSTLTWLAWCAGVSGLVGIVSLWVLLSRHSAAHPRAWRAATIAPTIMGAATSPWALISVGAVVPAWIFSTVVLVVTLLAVWFESPPEGTVRLVLAASGILVVSAGSSIGAALLNDNGRAIWGGVVVAIGSVVVVALGDYIFESFRPGWFNRVSWPFTRPVSRIPVPMEIGWIGPVVAVATSVVAAGPLTERLGVPNPGSEVMVSIIALVSVLQWVVQSVIVRTLRPTVESVIDIEELARDARTDAADLAASVARDLERSRRTDDGRPAMRSAEDLLERVRRTCSAAEYRELEARLHRTGRLGSEAEIRSLIHDYERRENRRDEHMQARSVIRRGSGLGMSRLLVGTATIAVNLATARDAGVVIDRIWPGIELVVPPFVRGRIAWLDRGVALSRVIVASAAAAALTFVAASLYSYAAVSLTFLAFALVAGRSRLELAYAQRAVAIGVYRVELLRALHMEVPATQAELVAMGDLLEGVSSTGLLLAALDVGRGAAAGGTNTTSNAPTPNATDQLTSTFIAEVKSELRELARAPATRLDTQVAEALATLQTRMDASIAEAVRAAMAGPSLVEFTGYVVVELEGEDKNVRRNAAGVICAPPGTAVGLSVSVLADQAARNSAPDRGAAGSHSFVALETITIEGRKTEAFAHFDILLDSATMTPSPRRQTLRVLRLNGEQSGVVELELPDIEAVHEAWLQLYQSGRLVQAIAIAVDTRASEQSSRGEQ